MGRRGLLFYSFLAYALFYLTYPYLVKFAGWKGFIFLPVLFLNLLQIGIVNGVFLLS
jgi:hypothetical protein